MTITTIPSEHFQGGRGVNVTPTTGSDVRSLETILGEIITDVNTAMQTHGNQLGGTLHADVVAGVSSGFMTAAQATTLAGIYDDHVYCRAIALNMKTDEHEHTAVLSGDAGKKFVATHLVIKVVTNAGGVPVGDGTINIGTAADGAQIVAAVATTGLTSLGATRMVPLAAHAVSTAGNATLYVNVESADTSVGTVEVDVYVIGRQV